MNEKTHFLTTLTAAQIANTASQGAFTERETVVLADACQQTDHWQDLEFVHVEFGRDDPHRQELFTANDIPHHSTFGKNHTAFNHFIDIRKGPGIFDDYDGYSYGRGSAHEGEYQKFSEVTRDPRWLLAAGRKIDEAINWWLNDEYVHAPGQPWYRNCSPALLRYSFPKDHGVYANRKDELLARFPLAGPHGRTGCGIPYSVFMPVDNLARHWFGEYRKTGVKKYLGPVLHAIQDASIPQHAAGCMGNWHDEYENCLDAYAPRFYQNRVFRQEVAGLLAAWDRIDANPPLQRLLLKDRQRTPARNWDISQLVPWTALQAYHAYVDAYFNFRRGFKVNARSLRRLYALALAMSAHILHHAQRISISIPAKAS